MPSVIFYDREYCPHCFNNKHHNYEGVQVPHLCEFCYRVGAIGEGTMSVDFFDRARKAEWKEILMFGVMRKE